MRGEMSDAPFRMLAFRLAEVVKSTGADLKEAVAKLTVTGQEAATQAHQSVLTLGQREVNDTNIRVVQCADVQPKVNGVEMVQWVLAVSAAQECRSAARVLRKSKVLEAAGIPV